MNKAELIQKVAEGAKVKERDAENVINSFIKTVLDELKQGNKVEIRGFGTFMMKKRAARVARNPKTGEKVNVPAKEVPVFRAGKDLDAVSKPIHD